LDDTDYIWETVEQVDGQIAAVLGEASDARAEVDLAKRVGLPAQAAERAVERLDERVRDLREMRERIAHDYPYWEQFGFETSVDASGEAVSWWQALSDGRLPLPVQAAYRRANETGLFSGYEVCTTFEPPDEIDEPVGRVSNYLFGLRDGDSRGFFLIESWDSDGDEG
jgi:hypothetical protein